MIFFIFFIYVPLVHSELHMLKTKYTGINGETIAGFPEVSSVTTLDGQQIDYYDSVIKKLIPKQDWMKEFASGDRWKEYTEIRERVQQTNKINMPVLKQQLNQPRGVHTYQRMYGCEWDDETEDSRGFDEYSYDGQRFISLDMKEIRYTEYVPQAQPTVMKWNNDREQLNILKKYYDYECVYWLKELLHFSGIVPVLTGQNLKGPPENDNKSEGSASYASYITPTVVVIIILVILILIVLYKILYALWNNWNQLIQYCKNFIYYKPDESDEQNQCTEPLTPSPEEGSSSPEEGSSSPEEGSSSPEEGSPSPEEGSSQPYPRNKTKTL